MNSLGRLNTLAGASAVLTVVLGRTACEAVARLAALPPCTWGPAQLTDCLVALGSAAGTAGALWHLVSALLALTVAREDLGRGGRPPTAAQTVALTLLKHWGAPLVRRAALGGVLAGLLVPATAVTATAVPSPPPDDLGWVPSASAPAESTTPSTTEAPAPPPTQESPATPSPPGGSAPAPAAPTSPAAGGTPTETDRPAGSRTVTVTAGESLWSVTEDLLGPEAGAAEIASSWPALYRENAERIGGDPDLILPGTRLEVPGDLGGSTPARGAG